MLNITSGKIDRAQKTVIYGPEGIGKTTLASQHPDPVIIDMEGGSAHMDVRRITDIKGWEDAFSVMREIKDSPGICKTIVIDTADWLEQQAIKSICDKYKQPSIESFGYGKGYTYVAEEFARFLALCNELIDAGINVVFIAHAKMRKFEQPDEMGAYDRWEMKLSKQAAPLLKEWCDHLLFCNYQTFVVTSENDTKKVQGGKRVIYTTHHPAWDAKSRANLPEVVDMDFSNIASIYPNAPEVTKRPIDELKEKLQDAPFDETALLDLMKSKGHCPEAKTIEDIPDKFITGWALKYWAEITKSLTEDKNTEE